MRASDPMDPYHGTVYTHEWLLKTVRNKVKTMELNRNADLILKNINNATPSSTIPGAVGVQEQGGTHNNKGAADGKDVPDAAGPTGPAGKGKGKNGQTPEPPTEERLASLTENEDEIKKQ